MIVNMSPNATEEQIEHVVQRVKECGYQAHVIRGATHTVIGPVETTGAVANWKPCKPRPASKRSCPSRTPLNLSAASCARPARWSTLAE